MDFVSVGVLSRTRIAAEGTQKATQSIQKSMAQLAQGTVPAATFNAVWAENQQLREDFRCADENLRLMEENRNQFREWGDKQAAKAKRLQAELTDALASRDKLQVWGKEQEASAKQLQAALDDMKKHRDEWQAWGQGQKARADQLLDGIKKHLDSIKKHRDEWQVWGKEQQARADKLQDELDALRQAQGQTA